MLNIVCIHLSLGFEGRRVGLSIPSHHAVQVFVVLLEADELFLDQDAATVVIVVAGLVSDVRHAVVAGPPVRLAGPFAAAVADGHKDSEETEPVHTFGEELEVFVMISSVEGFRSVEISLVATHPCLELDCVF